MWHEFVSPHLCTNQNRKGGPPAQLQTAKQGSTTKESYTYDSVGNRLSSLGVSPYTYNTSNELMSTPTVSYTYDDNGSVLTKSDGTQYTWDYENELTQVVLPGTGGTVNLKYDPFGRRIQKSFTQSGTTTTTDYLYDDSDLIEEIDSSGTVIARYTQGPRIDEPLAELRSGTTSFYEADGLHSTTSLSNSTGALANTYAYDSYGRLTASTGTVTNPLTYTGRDFDSETAIYYYRARYYEPATGRFISEDPIRFKGGIDFYSYALSSPTNLTDPMGLCPPEGCQPPNTHSPQPRSKCSTYTDYEHRTACRVLAGDDTVGQCVRGCLLDQYDTKTHSYKCDESKLHCLCFDACGYTSGLRARAARYHFDCNQPSGPKTQ